MTARVAYFVIALVFVVAARSPALDFSADMVSTARGSGSFTGKMFVSGDRSRMEVAGTITITRLDKGVAWMIVPEQNMFIEQPVDVNKVAGATDRIPGELERSLVGREAVGGKMTDKYRVVYTEKGAPAVNPGQRRVVVFQWIDPASGIPIRTASEDGSWSVEYNNLVAGIQPESLFEVPPQYAKMAMPNMSEMIAAAQRAAASQNIQTDEE